MVLPLGVAVKAKKLKFGLSAPGEHHLVQPVFPVRLTLLGFARGRSQNGFEFPGRLAGLAGMGLIHDNGIFTGGNGRFPLPGLFLFRSRCFFRAFRTGGLKQPPQHKGEFLQGGDDDLGSVDQGLGQLPGILVDGLDHPLGVFDLVDGILKLPVQHPPVGDDDHAVKDLLILGIMQAGQPVRKPGDAVGLAAAGGVLDQVVAARTLVTGDAHDPAHGVELMIAGENQLFPGDAPHTAAAVVDLFVLVSMNMKWPRISRKLSRSRTSSQK